MAINSVVEYTNEGLKVSKPEEGERHLVYVRPSDKIEIDFDAPDITYRLIDGDVVAVLPDGAQLVFIQLGSLALDGELSPQVFIKGEAVDLLGKVEVSPLIDQPKEITEKFLEFQAASKEHEQEEESLARQRELLEQTLESIEQYVSAVSESAAGGPTSETSAQGEQKSGDLSTVEFVQQTVEQVTRATESTTIPEPQEVNSNSSSLVNTETKSEDETATPQPPADPGVQFVTTLDVLQVRQTSETSADGVTYIVGGTGSIAGSETATDRFNDENLGSTSTGNQVVWADSGTYTTSTEDSQLLRINGTLPDGYALTSLTITGIPSNASLYSNDGTDTQLVANADGSYTLVRTTSDVSGQFSSESEATFIIQYSNALNAFTANITAQADSSDVTQETLTFALSQTFQVADVTTQIQADNEISIDGIDQVLSTQTTTNVITTQEGNDTVYGGLAADVINTGLGDDVITGGEGNDTIVGGEGVDTLYYGVVTNTDDNAPASQNTDFGYLSNASTSVISDLLDGSTSVNVSGTNVTSSVALSAFSATASETDSIDGVENIVGSVGTDVLRGDHGSNSLAGGAGNDFLVGRLGDDTLEGGSGSDTASYLFSTNSVTANLTDGTASGEGSDTLASIENLQGSVNDDVLIGSSDINTISGSGGNDTIQGFGGSDVLDGDGHLTNDFNGDGDVTGTSGEGIIETAIAGTQDTVDFSDNNAGITLTLNGDTAATVTSGANNLGTVVNFENVRGSQGSDTITGDGNDNTFFATSGTDILSGGAGQDTLSFIDYTNSSDAVTVDLGGGGSYSVTSGGSVVADSNAIQSVENVIGSAGDDTIRANATSGGVIDGADGADIFDFSNIAGSGVTVNLGGTTGADGTSTIHATTGSGEEFVINNVETVVGSNQDDVLEGGSNVDTLVGGDGDDRFIYTADSASNGGNDTFIGGAISAGADTGSDLIDFTNVTSESSQSVTNQTASGITYSATNQTGGLSVNLSDVDASGQSSVSLAAAGTTIQLQGIENVVGTNLDDLILGGSDNNSLFGGQGSDYLVGLAGNDQLEGGQGTDTLVGGQGEDTLNGGADFDWADYSNASSGVSANLSSGVVTDDGRGSNDTLSNIEGLVGSSNNDTVVGTSNSTVIAGLGSDAVSVASDGTGLYIGDSTNSLSDLSMVSDSSGNDRIDFSSITSGVNFDLSSSTGSFTMGGSAAAGQVQGFESITGTGQNDSLTGNSSSNTIQGGAGNDTIYGGSSGLDNLDGGSGVDTLDYSAFTIDRVTIDLSNAADQANIGSIDSGASQIVATNFENANGTLNSDIITGSNQDNVLNGNAGDDTLFGTEGADMIDGGAGSDAFSYAGQSGSITLNQGVNTVDLVVSGVSTTTNYSNVETFTGTAQNDTLNLSDTGELTEISGGSGDDTFNIVDLSATSGSIVLEGGGGNDTLSASGISATGVSVDTIAGATQVQTAAGGSYLANNIEALTLTSQNDTVDLMNISAEITINAGAGNDTITTGSGNDVIDGGAGTDAVEYFPGTASSASNTGIALTLDAAGTAVTQDEASVSTPVIGMDTLTNVESILLGGGDDSITIESAASSISEIDGSGGIDRLSFSTNTVNVTSTSATQSTVEYDGSGSVDFTISNIESFTGSSLGDSLNLSNLTADLTLDGGTGIDTLIGGSGGDTFIQSGTALEGDALTGGNGADTANYSSVTSDLTLNFGSNEITDGTTSDTISQIEGFTLGSGDDSLNLSIASLNQNPASPTATFLDSADFGAGTDTVAITSAASATTITSSGSGGNFSSDDFAGIEELDFTSLDLTGAGVSLDMEFLRDWASEISGSDTRQLELQVDSGITFNFTGTADSSSIAANTIALFEDSTTQSISGTPGVTSPFTTTAGGSYTLNFSDSSGGDELTLTITAT